MPTHHQSSNKILIGLLIISSIIILPALLILFLPIPTYTTGFATLKECAQYATQIDEATPMDGSNTIKPDFSTYFATLTPTVWKNYKQKIAWILTKLKIKSPPLWSAGYFKTQLEQLIKDRQGVWPKNSIGKITTTEQSRFYIFGNIQGSYHSLLRCLEKIKDLGVLDEKLTLTNRDTYIIFMGGVVDRSPFSMQTLSLVMALLIRNPSNVIYIRGTHESDNYWQEHSLKNELEIRARNLSTAPIPLEPQVNQFFQTLPIGLYLTTLHAPESEFIRISHFGRERNDLINEAVFENFLSKKSSQALDIQAISHEENADSSTIKIPVIFRGEKKRKTYQQMNGLRFLAPDGESMAWNILSAPNTVYQKALNFFHDAFVCITPAQETENWKISLFNRDVRTKEPFTQTTYMILTGLQADGNGGLVQETDEENTTKEKLPKAEQPQIESGIQQETVEAQAIIQHPEQQAPIISVTVQDQTSTQPQEIIEVPVAQPEQLPATPPSQSDIPTALDIAKELTLQAKQILEKAHELEQIIEEKP